MDDLVYAIENVLAHARKHTDGTVRLDVAWLEDLRVAFEAHRDELAPTIED